MVCVDIWALSQPHNCSVWHIELSCAICSPQAALQHTHCPFSVDDSEALASHSLLKWSVATLSSLHVITFRCVFLLNPKVQFRVDFMKDTLFMFGISAMVKSLDNESRLNGLCIPWRGNFSASHCWVMQKGRPLKNVHFYFCSTYLPVWQSTRCFMPTCPIPI